MLELDHISKTLGSFKVEGISFSVSEGDYFVLLGESGVGKSILLEIITGLMSADSGTIVMEGRDITNEKIQKRGIGLVYQDQVLFPHMTVRENIAYPLKCRGVKADQRNLEVEQFADKVGVTHLLDRDSGTLSLGEAQRTALARTLASKPKVLLLDEPLASLDIKAKSEMRALLRQINKEGQTVIHVTHDFEEAIALAQKITVLEAGAVAQSGTLEEIFQQPKSEFIANFVGIKNFYHGTLKRVSDDLGSFAVNGLSFDIGGENEFGEGSLILRSEDITLSKEEPHSSARNHFKGTVIDIEPARNGVEVRVDVGVPVAALILRESLETMALSIDDEIWVNFKACAAQFLKG